MFDRTESIVSVCNNNFPDYPLLRLYGADLRLLVLKRREYTSENAYVNYF